MFNKCSPLALDEISISHLDVENRDSNAGYSAVIRPRHGTLWKYYRPLGRTDTYQIISRINLDFFTWKTIIARGYRFLVGRGYPFFFARGNRLNSVEKKTVISTHFNRLPLLINR